MWATLIPIFVSIALGYMAGLYRDKKTETLLREREKINEIQTVSADIINGCQEIFNARRGSVFSKKLYDFYKLNNPGLEETIGKSHDLDFQQMISGRRQVNPAITKLRISCPHLVAPAENLLKKATEIEISEIESGPCTQWEIQVDNFAQQVSEAIFKKPRKLPKLIFKKES